MVYISIFLCTINQIKLHTYSLIYLNHIYFNDLGVCI
jgi:hypothetical protein